MKKIAFIENTWNNTKDKQYSGVGYYRLIQPARYITKYQIDVIGQEIKDWEGSLAQVFEKLFTEYDAVVTKAVDNPQAASALCFMAQHFKKPLIVDMDDNYFEVRPDQPGYRWYYPGSQKKGILSAYLSLATHLIVSTQPLSDYYHNWFKKKNGKTVYPEVLPNCYDPEEFKYSHRKNADKNKIVIGWQGSTTHLGDLKIVMPALRELMIKYKNLYLEFMGGIEIGMIKELFEGFNDEMLGRIKVIGGTPSWKKYPRALSRRKWDIGICPLLDDEFNRNKSHIKWMEYAAYKIPAVASKVYPYYKDIQGTKTISDGRTGYLASNHKEWVRKLSVLIESEELRDEIGQKAYEFINKEWDIKDHIYKWEKVFDKILK